MRTPRSLFLIVSLGLANLFIGPESAHAQRGAGLGPGRGFAAPVGRFPGGYSSSYYGNTYGSSFARSSATIGAIGVGGSFVAPISGFSTSGYVPSSSAYLPLTVAMQSGPAPAQIRVLVPDPNAKVWFDGNPTKSTGTDRLYHTPPLTAETGNTYRIRAAWGPPGAEMIQEQEVSATPGRVTLVDFTRPVPVEDPAAPMPRK